MTDHQALRQAQDQTHFHETVHRGKSAVRGRDKMLLL